MTRMAVCTHGKHDVAGFRFQRRLRGRQDTRRQMDRELVRLDIREEVVCDSIIC
jgi:hypothetical protein